MRILLNELSLLKMNSQEALRRALGDLMSARRNSPNLARVLYCSRRTGETQAIHGERLLTSVAKMPRDERGAILAWLGKGGPFFDDDREETDQDLYHLFGEEVTDLGPGEAARARQRDSDAQLLSFCHREDVDFGLDVLNVVQGFPSDPIATVDVPNIFDLSRAKDVADSCDPEPRTWAELLDVCRRRFSHLLIGTYCDEVLGPLTFYPVAARRMVELLRVLDDVTSGADERGRLNDRSESLVQDHFVGGKAWFTDESEENKKLFGTAMTFPDPSNDRSKIQCFWHGKIKTPQFRVHFEWPLPAGQQILKIAYMGPKISKK